MEVDLVVVAWVGAWVVVDEIGQGHPGVEVLDLVSLGLQVLRPIILDFSQVLKAHQGAPDVEDVIVQQYMHATLGVELRRAGPRLSSLVFDWLHA